MLKALLLMGCTSHVLRNPCLLATRMPTGHVALKPAAQLTGILFSLVGISSLGVLRSNQPFPVLVIGWVVVALVGGDGGAGEGDGVLENPKENQSWEEDEGILSFRRFWSN
ncbi:hypothetical protein Tco_1396720 [Tanacetum coccineum]